MLTGMQLMLLIHSQNQLVSSKGHEQAVYSLQFSSILWYHRSHHGSLLQNHFIQHGSIQWSDCQPDKMFWKKPTTVVHVLSSHFWGTHFPCEWWRLWQSKRLKAQSKKFTKFWNTFGLKYAMVKIRWKILPTFLNTWFKLILRYLS